MNLKILDLKTGYSQFELFMIGLIYVQINGFKFIGLS